MPTSADLPRVEKLRAQADLPGVDLWMAEAPGCGDHWPDPRDFLPGAEIGRAASHPSRTMADRFARGRILLRTVLGERLGQRPRDVALDVSDGGKPRLDERVYPLSPLAFNLSHAKGRMMLAVAELPTIGLDLAWIGGAAPIDAVARRFYSPAELAAVLDAPEGVRRAVFYRIWVRKEAYLKARGEGISQWIHQTDFSHSAEGVVPLLDSHSTDVDQDNWRVVDVPSPDLPVEFSACVAIPRVTIGVE